MPGNSSLPSGQLWVSAGVVVLVDVALILFLTWRVKPSRFRELKWALAGTAALLWSAFAVVRVAVFWNDYYRYFYPAWFRSGGILVFVPFVFGLLALAFHWLALRLPGNPLVTFCLLAGAESLLEHLVGIYGFKILAIPMLQSASPASMLTFAFPEYIFYWCVVIGLAWALQNGGRAWRSRRRKRSGVS
jgi:hypothetical protein